MSEGPWDVWVAVYPPPNASDADIRALGSAVAAFAAGEARVAIGGLDELLAGRYPPPHDTHPLAPDPDGPFEGITGSGRYSIPEPWRYCGALVRARRSELSD